MIENIQRSELNSLEEAEGYQLLTKKYNYTQEEISKAVGKSRSYIANVSRLLSLSELAKKYLLQKKLTVGQLRPLIGQDDCDDLLEMIYKKKLKFKSGRSIKIVGVKGCRAKQSFFNVNNKARMP